MCALVLCGILVSLSDVFFADEFSELNISFKNTPMWAAILGSLIMPLAFTLLIVIIKHANEV